LEASGRKAVEASRRFEKLLEADAQKCVEASGRIWKFLEACKGTHGEASRMFQKDRWMEGRQVAD
jgi:hypothetical protein